MVSCSLLFRCSILILWYIQPGSTFDFRFKDVNGNEIQDLDKHCKTNECLVKCCPQQQIIVSKLSNDSEEHSYCTSFQELVEKYGVANLSDFSEVDVYGKDLRGEIIKTNKSVTDFKFIHDSKFTEVTTDLGSFKDNSGFLNLLKNGTLALYRENNHWEAVTKRRQFCIEHKVSLVENDTLASITPSVNVWVIQDPPISNLRDKLNACSMLVSCVFLLLVLAVYALLPELRNLAGLILMACMATYLVFFMTRVIHIFGNDCHVLRQQANAVLTVIFYYLTLSSYCWINIMSFDIWWTFRGIRNMSGIHRRGVMSKFWQYCAYAWGAPVLPALFVVIVDNIDTMHLPNFVKPQLPTVGSECSYFAPEVYVWYVSIPISILICLNVLLFLLTAYNIWEVKRRVSGYNFKERRNNKKNEYRFWIYLRLSLVTGVSWLLETINAFVYPESLAWFVADQYNALFGLFIFLLFVCKKKIFLRLCSRFSIDNRLVRRVRTRAGVSRPADGATTTGQSSDFSDAEAHLSSVATVRV